MDTDPENRAEIRRRVPADGLSGRAACREHKIHRKTLDKILDDTEPPGHRRTRPRRPSIGEPLPPVVHQALEDDKKASKRQRHTARRIFDRLRGEHGYQGGLSRVKVAVLTWRARTAEVLVPLAHPPGEAQADPGHAEVTPSTRPIIRPCWDASLGRWTSPPHRPAGSCRSASVCSAAGPRPGCRSGDEAVHRGGPAPGVGQPDDASPTAGVTP